MFYFFHRKYVILYAARLQNKGERVQKSKVLTLCVNTMKGVFLGIANAVPGVSGGTIAVITGIYEPLTEFFASVVSRNWKKTIKGILPLLMPVAMGGCIGIVLFANLIDYLFASVPSQTQFLFIGLILGSFPFLLRQSRKTPFRWSYSIPLVLSTSLLIWLAIYSFQIGDRSVLIAAQPIIRSLTPATTFIIIGAGILSAGVMIIPGVSGAFLMVILGLYATLKTMIVEINIPIILTFLAGVVLGLLIFAKLITFLLQKFHGPSYHAILGLVLGSIAFLWPGLEFNLSGLSSVVVLIIGFLTAFFLSTDPKEK